MAGDRDRQVNSGGTDASESPAPQMGVVVAVQANFYRVKLGMPGDRERPAILCTRRTRLKKLGQDVMVGDRVWVEAASGDGDRGAIAEVLPRETELQRPPVANARQILLVFAIEEPSLDEWQLSRFLVKAESTSLELCLCLNKLDLVDAARQQDWQQRLAGWGYEPVWISVNSDRGLSSLADRLRDKVSIVAGPSGVGKSSLINRLVPDVRQRVKAVSGKLQKGRHTTRHVELFELPKGGLIADTPGFNQPDLDCPSEELAQFFPEARSRLERGHCQFNNCLHRDEPNCVVRGDWERYEHYLKFLDEAIAREWARERRPDAEATVKAKTKETGQIEYEPKLETKKYRRPSRRTRHQTLQSLCDGQPLQDLEDDDFDEGW